MKLKFIDSGDFKKGIEQISAILDFEISESGIQVFAVQGEKLGASFKDGIGYIYYNLKNQFFRELGIFLENIKKNEPFEVFEDGFFKTTGVMVDTSRGGVPKVETLHKMTDYLALMGYNMLLLYTEDTVEIKNHPYFGYMRGRYTKEELCRIDDYAYEYGIEVIPCLECYGHMEQYLQWEEAVDIRDTERVLLAREEKTFKFLEELISETSSCFRSNRIHIGMDEAWNMGRGEFLTKNGYVEPIDIFNEYMQRLIQITNKYNLTPMMWADMYFRVNNTADLYYEEETEIPEATKKCIPKEVQLVFWHYGEKPKCDEYMLEKHKELNRDIIFAGGLWSWIGHFPENNYSFETTRFSLNACRKYGVREMMTTIWTNDNAECDWFSNLLGMSFTAELCYNNNAVEKDFRARFEFCTGGSYDAFYEMSNYHNIFDEQHSYKDFHDRFLGKTLFWQDILEGLFDTHLEGREMSRHYKDCAERMKTYKGKWNSHYELAFLIFDYLAIKTEISEKAVSAYQRKDRETLSDISGVMIPKLSEAVEKIHMAHRKMWFENNKTIGWSNLEVRYAGVKARCNTAVFLIESYLKGENDAIEAFEIKRLHKPLNGFIHYSSIATSIIDIT